MAEYHLRAASCHSDVPARLLLDSLGTPGSECHHYRIDEIGFVWFNPASVLYTANDNVLLIQTYMYPVLSQFCEHISFSHITYGLSPRLSAQLFFVKKSWEESLGTRLHNVHVASCVTRSA